MLNEELILKSKQIDFFPEAIKMLIDAGVTRYFVDLISGRITYYNDNLNSFFIIEEKYDNEGINYFNIEKLKLAIKWAQSGNDDYTYKKFISLIKEAGISAYIVYIKSNFICYFSSNGKMHKEFFI